MSYVAPPARKAVECHCGFRTFVLAGLRVHQRSAHRGAGGDGLPVGLKRPRAESGDGGLADDRRGPHQPLGTAATTPTGGDTSGESPPPVDGGEQSDASDFSTGSAAMEAELRALYEMTRTAIPTGAADVASMGAHAATMAPEYSYSSVATHIRALYEEMQDVQRSTPLADFRRKRPHTGRFNSFRLRALQNFVLSVGGAGLSLQEQERLFNFLDVWDRTQPGMPTDDGHNKTLRDAFDNVNEFRNAIADDLDAAVNVAGWRKVVLEEDGAHYEAYFRSVMGVVRDLVASTETHLMHWWSGGSAPAPASDRRETPMDGEVFREYESEVMSGGRVNNAVLGIHIYSDSSQLSWSGGKFRVVWRSAGTAEWPSRLLCRECNSALVSSLYNGSYT